MPANLWKPTQAECDLLKRAASLESESKVTMWHIRLEPQRRISRVDDTRPASINIALVSDDPQWADTDLHDCGDWADFRKGIQLTADGRATVELAIRPRTPEVAEKHYMNDLLGHLVAFYADGKLVAIRELHSHGHNYLPDLLPLKQGRA